MRDNLCDPCRSGERARAAIRRRLAHEFDGCGPSSLFPVFGTGISSLSLSEGFPVVSRTDGKEDGDTSRDRAVISARNFDVSARWIRVIPQNPRLPSPLPPCSLALTRARHGESFPSRSIRGSIGRIRNPAAASPFSRSEQANKIRQLYLKFILLLLLSSFPCFFRFALPPLYLVAPTREVSRAPLTRRSKRNEVINAAALLERFRGRAFTWSSAQDDANYC